MEEIQNQKKDDQEEIDNSVLELDCIIRTYAFQLQISLLLICRLIILRMWEPRQWYHPITPWSHG